MNDKAELRRTLRAARRAEATALPDAVRGLILHRPPAPLLDIIPADAIVGLYHPTPDEAPTGGYARFLFENGHTLALPRFAERDSAMEFARFEDPFDFSDCEVGPFGVLQPLPDAETLVPDILFVPLVGFTDAGARLGQGGGHYDRWLATHPATLAIGLAWDSQRADSLPTEPHDRPLNAIVTPTRLYGPF